MRLRLSLLAVALVALAACASSGAASVAPSASAAQASPSAAASAAPSAEPSASASSGAVDLPIDTAEKAAARVGQVNTLLAGIKAKDPDAVGQPHYWEATRVPGGWQLEFHVGWGDCPAGCIDEHVWTYEVRNDGAAVLVKETGDRIPPEVATALQGSFGTVTSGVSGTVQAGPICPVAKPNDPNCADRPVQGAVIIARGADGTESARAQTDAAGKYAIELPTGDYTIEPQPIDGLMGTPNPAQIRVQGDAPAKADFIYDTGIR